MLFGSELYERVMQDLGENYDTYGKTLFPETIPILKKLGASGLWLSAVTSVSESIVTRDALTTGIDWGDFFEHVQTANETDYHKPDGRVFDPTKSRLARVGIQNWANVIYIGDGMGDLLAAKEAGFGFVGVEKGFMSQEDFIKAGAISIPSIAKLVNDKPSKNL